MPIDQISDSRYQKSDNQNGFIPIFIIIAILILAAVAFGGYYLYQRFQGPTEVPSTNPLTSLLQSSPSPSSSPSANLPNDCGPGCQAAINSKVDSLRAELLKTLSAQITTQLQSTNPLTAGSSPAPITSATTSAPTVYYVTMGTGGSTQSTSFIELTGTQISFDTGNYPGAKGFYFQANLQSDAPDRTSYARVYDVTHGVSVSGSDINFTGLTSTFKESTAMNLPSGKVTLDVQTKSFNGNLSSVQNPRIKIQY